MLSSLHALDFYVPDVTFPKSNQRSIITLEGCPSVWCFYDRCGQCTVSIPKKKHLQVDEELSGPQSPVEPAIPHNRHSCNLNQETQNITSPVGYDFVKPRTSNQCHLWCMEIQSRPDMLYINMMAVPSSEQSTLFCPPNAPKKVGMVFVFT